MAGQGMNGGAPMLPSFSVTNERGRPVGGGGYSLNPVDRGAFRRDRGTPMRGGGGPMQGANFGGSRQGGGGSRRGGGGGFDVNRAAANALRDSMKATRRGLNQKAARVGAGRIDRFMNPYEDQVVQQSMRDIGEAQQQALDLQGYQADRAKAFGGSRHGIAEAETRLGYGQQMADTSEQMRQQGFQTALGAAQQDVQNINAARQARLGAASQLAGLGQQAFGTGQAIQQQQMQQGLMQQQMQQQLIDAARGQYAGYTGAPQASINSILAGLSGMPSQGSTASNQPGLLSYLQLASAFM